MPSGAKAGAFETLRQDTDDFMAEYRQRKDRVDRELHYRLQGYAPENFPTLSVGELEQIRRMLER